MKNKKNTAEEIEIKPSKTCDMCDWKTNYTCCDCERIQGGSGLHYNDYDYFVRLTNGKKDYINRYEKPQAPSAKLQAPRRGATYCRSDKMPLDTILLDN